MCGAKIVGVVAGVAAALVIGGPAVGAASASTSPGSILGNLPITRLLGGIPGGPSLVNTELPGYASISPQAAAVLDSHGPMLPDGMRVPTVPGKGILFSVTTWNPQMTPTADSITVNGVPGMYFVPANPKSDWDMVITTALAGSSRLPIARLIMFCNMMNQNVVAEYLTGPYIDGGVLTFNQSATMGGSWGNDIFGWAHRFLWSGMAS